MTRSDHLMVKQTQRALVAWCSICLREVGELTLPVAVELFRPWSKLMRMKHPKHARMVRS